MSTSVSDTTKSSRREQRSRAQAFIDRLKGMAHPNSRRIFIEGSRADIRVPLREIQLADTANPIIDFALTIQGTLIQWVVTILSWLQLL